MDRVRKKPKDQRRQIQKSQASDVQRGLGQEVLLLPYRGKSREITLLLQQKVSELYSQAELPKALKSHF